MSVQSSVDTTYTPSTIVSEQTALLGRLNLYKILNKFPPRVLLYFNNSPIRIYVFFP